MSEISFDHLFSLLVKYACFDVTYIVQPGTFLDSKKQQIMYSDFVTKKLKLYFTTSNQRKHININKKNYILKKNDKKSKKIILKKYEKKVIQYIIIVLLI